MKRLYLLKLVLTALLLFACSKAPSQPDVILITVDTLRQDHVGAFSPSAPATPFMDGLARDGIVFNSAYTNFNLTNPAHTTMLTGMLAKHHGIYTNRLRLPPSAQTLAEQLQSQGYQTVAAVSVPHLNPNSSGLGQGFETFFPSPDPERQAEETLEAVLPWLETRTHQPLFLWIHLFDPHTTYEPPAPFDTRYYAGNPRVPGPPLLIDLPGIAQGPNRQNFKHWLRGVTDPAYPPALYRGEVSYADEAIGRLLEAFKARDRYRGALVMLTADHGESLSEHDVLYSHNALYEPIFRVPLIVKLPNNAHGKTRVQGLVQTADLLPTVLDVLKFPPLPSATGLSLLPLMTGTRAHIHDHLFLESAHPPAQLVVTPRYKLQVPPSDPTLMRDEQTTQPALFDLQADPAERNNLIQSQNALALELGKLLGAWMADRSRPSLRPLPQDDKALEKRLLEQLKALGYVQ